VNTQTPFFTGLAVLFATVSVVSGLIFGAIQTSASGWVDVVLYSLGGALGALDD
jgi:hypothetical protein